MNAEEVIAAHQPLNGGFFCTGCVWTPRNGSVTDNEEFAGHQLAKLKAAGYAVVELPETQQVNVPRPQQYWTVNNDQDALVTIRPSDGKIANDGVSNPYRTPADAHAHAVALLAAANAAESNHV